MRRPAPVHRWARFYEGLHRQAESNKTNGEKVSRSELLSLMAQRLMRRWTTVWIYVVGSLLWWHFHWFHDKDLSSWNRWASLMALVIETVVGIGVFSMSMRDSKVLHRLEQQEEANKKRDEWHEKCVDKPILAMVRDLYDYIMPDGPYGAPHPGKHRE